MIYSETKGGDIMPKSNKKIDILRYVALQLEGLKGELNAVQKKEMEEIRARLELNHEQILSLGKVALSAE